MAATSFIVTIITSAAFDFGSTTSFIASIVVNTTTFSNRTFIVQPDGITAISNPIPSFFPAGSALEFYINPFSTSIFNPPPDFGDFLGTFSVETNVGQISSTDGIINTINGSQTVTSVPATIIVACLHGSSLIQMKTGTKRLDQLKDGDEILPNKFQLVSKLNIHFLNSLFLYTLDDRDQ